MLNHLKENMFIPCPRDNSAVLQTWNRIFTLHNHRSLAIMTVTTPLNSMINHLRQLAVQEGSSPSPQTHLELLRMIDQLRLTVETPTETILRLIYQVWEKFSSKETTSLWWIMDLTKIKPPQNATLRTVVGMGIFPLLMQKQYRQTGISADQLAEYTHADKDLVGKSPHRSSPPELRRPRHAQLWLSTANRLI